MGNPSLFPVELVAELSLKWYCNGVRSTGKKYHFRALFTAEEALEHPYLSSMHDETDEPTCSTHFKFDVDEQSLSEEDIRELIYQEGIMSYRHPNHHILQQQ